MKQHHSISQMHASFLDWQANKSQYYGINILGEEASATSQRLSTLDLQVVVFWLPAPHAELHRSGLLLHFQVHTSALKGY